MPNFTAKSCNPGSWSYDFKNKKIKKCKNVSRDYTLESFKKYCSEVPVLPHIFKLSNLLYASHETFSLFPLLRA